MGRFPRGSTGVLAIVAGSLLLLPLAGIDLFLIDVLTSGLLLSVFVGSWDLVGGVAGQISLGHALFFGIATYAIALLTSLCGWPFPAAACGALFLSAAAAAAVGTASARLQGPFVALLTLALGELAHEIMLGQTFFAPRGSYSWGGEGGVPVAVPPGISSPLASYYGAILFFFLSGWGMMEIARSRAGLLWTAMAGSELTARASGVDVSRHKRLAFVASGLFAGAAGVGFAAHVERATASDFSLELSFQAVTFAAIGGRGTIAGPMVASLALHAVLLGGGAPPTARVLLYVLVLVFVLRFFPSGVAGTLRERLRERKMAPEGADR